MISRIVRLTIVPEKVEEFKFLFRESFPLISTFPGCTHLELYHEYEKPNVLITYSKWKNAEDLENYRASEVFRSTWAKVKPLFEDAPMAFSMVTVI